MWRIRSGCAGVFEDDIQSFFTDHVDGGNDEKAGSLGEDRSIDHAQSLGMAYAKTAIRERSTDLVRSNFVGAGRMMTPRFVLNKLAQLFARNGGSRDFLGRNQPKLCQPSLMPRANSTPATTASRSSPRASLPSEK